MVLCEIVNVVLCEVAVSFGHQILICSFQFIPCRPLSQITNCFTICTNTMFVEENPEELTSVRATHLWTLSYSSSTELKKLNNTS